MKAGAVHAIGLPIPSYLGAKPLSPDNCRNIAITLIDRWFSRSRCERSW